MKLHFRFPRIYRATISAAIVQASQTLSGINIIAFLATTFFSTAGLQSVTDEDAQARSYKLAIGFGATNLFFSAFAYFFIEGKVETADEAGIAHLSFSEAPAIEGGQATMGLNSNAGVPGSNPASDLDPGDDFGINDDDSVLYATAKSRRFRGRRFLLLLSLAGSFVTLLITSFLFSIEDSTTKLALVGLFIMLFTAFYSLGTGPIPFLYCGKALPLFGPDGVANASEAAEVFPNEGRGRSRTELLS